MESEKEYVKVVRVAVPVTTVLGLSVEEEGMPVPS